MYELQNMFHYALYYFARAVASRPRDYRMWNALGNNYEKLEKRAEALRCYERSENFKDREGIALFKKARMYDILGFQEKAVKCFEENLMRKDEERQVDKVIFFPIKISRIWARF